MFGLLIRLLIEPINLPHLLLSESTMNIFCLLMLILLEAVYSRLFNPLFAP